MAIEDVKKLRERKRYFSGLATKTVVDFLVHDKTLPFQKKMEAFQLARKIASKKGYFRVTWQDFCQALRQVKLSQK